MKFCRVLGSALGSQLGLRICFASNNIKLIHKQHSKLTSVSFIHLDIFIFVPCFICISLISCDKVNMAMVLKLSNSS